MIAPNKDEFNLLPLATRAVAVWDHAIHLVDVFQDKAKYSYYKLDRYYVQVTFERNDKLRMLDIHSFDDGRELDKLRSITGRDTV